MKNIFPCFMFVLCVMVCGEASAQGPFTPRLIHAGNGTYGVPQAIFFVHRLGTDPAEGITLDMDGDGKPELLTGKRYREHSGHDPGSHDPLVVHYYKIDRKTAKLMHYAISVNETAGTGTQFVKQDLDGDIDIATAGKTGVHFFRTYTSTTHRERSEKSSCC